MGENEVGWKGSDIECDVIQAARAKIPSEGGAGDGQRATP